MDKLKYIKLEQQDGSYSASIPLSVDAEHIDMEDGETLVNKISKKPYYYNSVADMKADTKLKAGDMAVTLGYYEPNDGGAAEYKIVQSSDKYTETLDNNLKAEIDIKDKMCVNQFGAKGDGVTDDTLKIQATVDNSSYITFLANKTYMIKGYYDEDPQGSGAGIHDTRGIVVPSHRIIDLTQATLKIITNNKTNYNVFTIKQVEDIIIKNGTLIGDVDTHTGTTGEWGYGIALLSSKNIHLKDMYITKMWGDGINLQCDGTGYPQNSYTYIDNIVCDDNRRQGMSVESCSYLYVTNCQFINTGVTRYTAPGAGVDVEPLPYGSADHMYFTQCLFSANTGANLIAMNNSSNLIIDNCEFLPCLGTGQSGYISFPCCKNYTIKNCYLEANIDGEAMFAFLGFAVSDNEIYFENNRIKNVGLIIHHAKSNDRIFIKNNIFDDKEQPFDWNNIIECQAADTTAIANNICYIDNNLFLGSEVLQSHVTIAKLSGITDIQFTNNTLIRGLRGVRFNDSAKIIGNHFISQRNSSLELTASSSNLKEGKSVYNVENNIIENPNCRNTAKGIIYNPYSTNAYYILNNNVCYEKYCINPDYRYDTDVGPSNVRWLENTTTGRALIEDSNHIYVINFEDGSI